MTENFIQKFNKHVAHLGNKDLNQDEDTNSIAFDGHFGEVDDEITSTNYHPNDISQLKSKYQLSKKETKKIESYVDSYQITPTHLDPIIEANNGIKRLDEILNYHKEYNSTVSRKDYLTTQSLAYIINSTKGCPSEIQGVVEEVRQAAQGELGVGEVLYGLRTKIGPRVCFTRDTMTLLNTIPGEYFSNDE